KPGEKVRIDGYEVPVEFLETREEKVKETGVRFIPHVVEPSFGVERLVYSTMEHNLRMREDRLILSLPFRLAPIQASVYPLVNKDGLVERARSVYDSLAQEGLRVEYDDSGCIGRRYARAAEAGIPLGRTIADETMTDDPITKKRLDNCG